MTKVVLVTGGAGFIGSNVVADLCDRGVEVAVCDRFRDAALGKWRNIAHHAVADLVPPARLSDWLATHADDLAAIVHMGAVSSTTEADVDKIAETNFGLSRDLWRFATERSVPLVYASSAATYGDGAQGFEDADDLQSLQRLRPLNAYGWSKALFDVYAARNAERGLAPPHWAGLKFFNVYGPNEYHKGPMKSVAAQIWPEASEGKTVRLFKSHRADYADGGQLRDFVYVRDVTEVIGWLLGASEVNGVFNLGSGRARSFADLATAVFRAAGHEPAIQYVDMPEGIRDKYQYFTEADMSRLRAAGYPGQFTQLEAGISDYVGRYLSQPDPYR